MRDNDCVLGPPGRSCWGSVCTDGGPVTCLACTDWAALYGAPASYCALRAAGRHRAACEVRFPDEPSRCVSVVDR